MPSSVETLVNSQFFQGLPAMKVSMAVMCIGTGIVQRRRTHARLPSILEADCLGRSRSAGRLSKSTRLAMFMEDHVTSISQLDWDWVPDYTGKTIAAIAVGASRSWIH